MPRETYGILDLFTLVAKLLAPFVDPLRAEFARTPFSIAPPAPAPSAPVQIPAQVPEVVPAPSAQVEPPELVPVPEPVMIVARVSSPSLLPLVEGPTSQAESAVYVRKPAGKKWRYVVAPPNARGTLFRKSLKGRTTYEPCL